MERLFDAGPRGWDIRHHFVWELHVLHRWTAVIRVLREREGDSGGIVCFFNVCGGVFGARVETKDRRGAVPHGVDKLGRGGCTLAFARAQVEEGAEGGQYEKYDATDNASGNCACIGGGGCTSRDGGRLRRCRASGGSASGIFGGWTRRNSGWTRGSGSLVKGVSSERSR